MEIQIARRFQGPPTMGHGGYVAGLFAARSEGPLQVTLRRPTPLDTPLELRALDGGKLALHHGDTITAESEPAVLELTLPTAPSLEQARAAETGSPSHYDGRGVHPTCFGCGLNTTPGEALRIFAGPLEHAGQRMVAAAWRPDATMALPTPGAGAREVDDGADVNPQWVLAALDCPGAFAFIAERKRAGLLGRIVFEQFRPVAVERDHIVVGWQAGEDGRKLFAGTALFDADGTPLAAARATWFGPPPR